MAGKPKATAWAVVARNGVTVRGKGIVSSAAFGGGTYEVITNKNISQCAFLATIGDIDSVGTELPGEITTVGRVTSANGVFVTTHNSAGTGTDRSFHLLVVC
jgi:hypothetical protein